MTPEQSAAVERLRLATTEGARSVSRTDVVNILAALDEAQQPIVMPPNDATKLAWECIRNEAKALAGEGASLSSLLGAVENYAAACYLPYMQKVMAERDEAMKDATKHRNIGTPIAPEHEEELQRLSDEAVRRHHQDMADAARYRYLRNRQSHDVFNKDGSEAGAWIDCTAADGTLVLLTGEDADAAIDAARASAGGAA